MKLLLLGGMSPRNKSWIREVEKTLAPLFDETIVHEYAHWNNPALSMDIDAELIAVSSRVSAPGEYIIFAKSVGTILALKGIQEAKLTPRACFCAGLPLSLVQKQNTPVVTWLAECTMPITLVQNTDDPAGPFAEVKTYLSPLPQNLQLLELPGDTHDYNDLGKLRQLVKELLVLT